MSAAIIAQLVIQLGPAAFSLIRDLIAVWSTPSLSADQVKTICDNAQKSYDSYIADAKALAAGRS